MTLNYRQQILSIQDAALPELADQFGTPLYVYSQAAMLDAARALDAALGGSSPHLIAYAVKANPLQAVIQTFAREGFGADVTSGGELYRALQAGIPPDRIVYSGVGKTPAEMHEALEAGIRAFHVESEGELSNLAGIAAERQTVASVSLRANPDVDPHTHPHIATGLRESKFGLSWERIPVLIQQIQSMPSLRLVGLSVHIGSQITELDPFRRAAQRVTDLARDLLMQDIRLEYLDFGGGLGIRYDEETPPSPAEWGAALRAALGDLPLALMVEPGRSLVASAGLLLTRVLYLKSPYVIVDAGMNDLIRPMLYGAHHPIQPVVQRPGTPTMEAHIAGPVCESTDVLARSCVLPQPQPGDLLAVLHAGAYGSSMASTYNSRRRPAEVMILALGESLLIRTRDAYPDLMLGEHPLP